MTFRSSDEAKNLIRPTQKPTGTPLERRCCALRRACRPHSTGERERKAIGCAWVKTFQFWAFGVDSAERLRCTVTRGAWYPCASSLDERVKGLGFMILKQ